MPTRRGKDEGSIYQRASDGKWCASVNLGWEDGKRRRKVIYGDTRREVADALKKLHADQQQGINIAPKKVLLKDFLEYWLKEIVKIENSIGTYERYEANCRMHIAPAIGHIKVSALNERDVQLMLNNLKRIPTKRKDKALDAEPLSPATVKQIRNTIIAALDKAIPLYTTRNVAKNTVVAPVEKPEIQPLTEAQARQLLDLVAGHQHEPIYRIALSLGLRKGEILALRWEDVNIEQSTIRISGTVRRVKQDTGPSKVRRLKQTKTTGSAALVPVPPVLMLMLRHVEVRQAAAKLRAGARWKDTGLVFTSKYGLGVDPRALSLHFKKIIRKIGLPDVTRFHDLRHSCATFLIAQGVHPRVVMQVLRHTKIATTMEIYGHVFDDTQREATDMLDALWSPETLELPPKKPAKE